MVEARQLDQSTVLDTSYNMERAKIEARRMEMENARNVSIEVHQQMVNRFEKTLLDLREQLSQVTEDLKQKEAMLVAVKEKLMSEQRKLSEKINELSTEITRRLTAEEPNYALQKALNELDNNLKDTQNQVVSLGFELAKKERVVVAFQEEQERTKQELQADILSLKDKLCRISEMHEGFDPQSVMVELGSVEATLSALQKNQALEQAKVVDWQEKLRTLEKALCSNDKQVKELTVEVHSRVSKREVNDVLKSIIDEMEKRSTQIKELTSEVDSRVSKREVNDVLKNVMEEMEKQSKQIKELTTAVDSRVSKSKVNDVLKNVVDEMEKQSTQIKDLTTEVDSRVMKREVNDAVKNVMGEMEKQSKQLKELTTEVDSRVSKREVNDVLKNVVDAMEKQSTQIKELTTEVDSRVSKREVNDVLKNVVDEMEKQSKQLEDRIKLIGSEQEKNEIVVGFLQEDWKTHRNELQTLTTQHDLNVQGVLAELSNVKNKLTDLQEEQKHQQASIREAQQQMTTLEGRGLELVERIHEEAEAQKQALLDEVRTLVAELLEASHLPPGNGMEDEESDAAKLDVRHLRNLITDSGIQTSSSELNANISSHDQYDKTLHGGAQEMPDKRTASLEAFFSVMGQLIRQELKRMDATSAESLPLEELHNSGGLTPYAVSGHVHGSGGTYKNREDQGQNFITLRYESSWNRAFVHYCADNHGWTEVPGMAMQEASNIKGKYWKEFKIKATRLEFVVTDGQGNWDRAPNGCNYVLEKPGIFELSAGVLKAVSSN